MAAKLTQKHKMAWRSHLGSEAGALGLLYLREKVPGVTADDAEKIIFKSGVSEGWRQAIEAISDLVAGERDNLETSDKELENP